MMTERTNRQAARWIGVLGLSVLTAGCGAVGDFGGDAAKTIISGNAASQSAIDVDPQVFRQDVPCPSIEVEAGRYIVMSYARGREDDPRGLRYQASLEEWANQCVRTATGVGMTLGVSGRVTPGPEWTGGEIFLPLTLIFEPVGDETRKAESISFTVPVTLGQGAPAEQWALVEQGITLPQGGAVKAVIALGEAPR